MTGVKQYQAVKTPADLGQICCLRRKELGLRIQDAAMIAGVNYRFVSNLENGKPMAENVAGNIDPVMNKYRDETPISARALSNIGDVIRRRANRVIANLET